MTIVLSESVIGHPAHSKVEYALHGVCQHGSNPISKEIGGNPDEDVSDNICFIFDAVYCPAPCIAGVFGHFEYCPLGGAIVELIVPS